MTGSSHGGVDFGKLFVSIDAMDTEGFLGFIAHDGEFRFGSSPPVNGHAGIRTAVEGFFSSFAELRHELQRMVADGNSVVCEGEVTYRRHDGSEITLPFANVFGLQGDRIKNYK